MQYVEIKWIKIKAVKLHISMNYTHAKHIACSFPTYNTIKELSSLIEEEINLTYNSENFNWNVQKKKRGEYNLSTSCSWMEKEENSKRFRRKKLVNILSHYHTGNIYHQQLHKFHVPSICLRATIRKSTVSRENERLWTCQRYGQGHT